MSLNKDMGDAHEGFLVSLFKGRQSKGSGNQWHNPMDGRVSSREEEYAFAWDGKSTLGKSIGVTLSMWQKACDQSFSEKTMLGLRWYANERLDVIEDLVVINAHDMAEVLEAANQWARVKSASCLQNQHSVYEMYCEICGLKIIEGVL